MTEPDVIIVGAGGSGLAAAARCVELGLSVRVLEKQAQIGGTTGIAVGSFTANGTSQQARAGIVDSASDHAEDAAKFPQPEIEARNNDALRKYFLSHTADTLQWLVDMGLSFHGPSPEPPNRVPRMHNVAPNAKAYIAALQAKVLQGGGEIICNASVDELIQEGEQVSGVIVHLNGSVTRMKARRAVVLAAGDYANSSELITRFKGGEYSEVEGINPHAQGDGHRLAEAAGAKLLNMDVTYGPELRFVAPPSSRTDFAQLLPASGWPARLAGKILPWTPKWIINAIIKRLLVTWQHPEDQLFEQGAILINRQGRRFCDERHSPQRELSVAQQEGKTAFILLDEQLIDLFSQWPNFISTAPEIAYAYVGDYLRLRPDVAIQASCPEELANLRGIPADAVRETVATVNAEAESDTELKGNRWVLLGPLKAYFTTTEGGAAIDEQMRVLNQHGQLIPGLFAIGQNGLGGQVLWGHGLHIAWAITSGKLLAEHLANNNN